MLPVDTDEQMLGDLPGRPNEMQARHVESSSTSKAAHLPAALRGARGRHRRAGRTRGTSRDPNDVVPPDYAARIMGIVVPSVLPEKTQP